MKRKRTPTAIVVALIGSISLILTTILTVVLTPVLQHLLDNKNTKTADAVNTALPADSEYAAKLLSEARQWPLIVKDEFDTNKLNWPEGNTIDQNIDATRTVANSSYSWRLKAKAYSANVWAEPNIATMPNFYVAVDIRSVKQLDNLASALGFRDQGASIHYDFMIFADQHFAIHYRGQGQKSSTSLASLSSQYIQPLENNRLAVIGLGSQFWFYISDVFVDYLADDKIATGSFGLAMAVKNIGDEGFIEFDNFELRKPP